METLSIELIWKIIYFLDDKDYLSFSLISRRYREVIREDNRKGVIKINIKNYKIFLNNKFSLPSNKFNLNLSWCNEITDVNFFKEIRNVHTLDLRGCSGIKDVSSLDNVHTLNLRYCSGIKDVNFFEKLKNVKNLYFRS